jgi:hypothetical protein
MASITPECQKRSTSRARHAVNPKIEGDSSLFKSPFSRERYTHLIGVDGWYFAIVAYASGTVSACYIVLRKNWAQMKSEWTSKVAKSRTFMLSARNADEILDHLALMVRQTGRSGGRIGRIQGMDLNYWSDRINTVINKTDPFSAQQKRAKLLLSELRSSDRA